MNNTKLNEIAKEKIKEIIKNYGDYCNHEEYHTSDDDCSNEIDDEQAVDELYKLTVGSADIVNSSEA